MLGGGLSRLRGAVGGKGAERGRMGNWGHGVKSGKTKKTERREQLSFWAWEAWSTWAHVLESRAQAWGACQPSFPQGGLQAMRSPVPAFLLPSLPTRSCIPGHVSARSHVSTRSVWTRSSKACPPRRVNLPSSVNNHSRGSPQADGVRSSWSHPRWSR